MLKTFKDSNLQGQFEQKGYVIVPLLDKDEIDRLYQLFAEHKAEYNQPFHTSHFSTGVDYKKHVNDEVINVVFPKVAPLLDNYKPIFGNLMIKQPNSTYFMPLHADWAYVDENKSRSVAVWVPLVDTNEENGCLGVIEGSHKVISKIRGPRIDLSTHNNDMAWVEKFGKLLPMAAGHAVIYDHALMHFSPPNKAAEIRPAVNLSVVPAGEQIVHFCVPEGAAEIEIYRVDSSDFYLHYNNYQRPQTNSLIKTIPVNTVTLVDEKMEKFGRTEKKGFFARFFG